MTTVQKKTEATLNKEKAMDIALDESIKYGVVGFLVGGLGTLLASKKWVGFQKYMSGSAKTVSPTIPLSFSFVFCFNILFLVLCFSPYLSWLAFSCSVSSMNFRSTILKCKRTVDCCLDLN